MIQMSLQSLISHPLLKHLGDVFHVILKFWHLGLYASHVRQLGLYCKNVFFHEGNIFLHDFLGVGSWTSIIIHLGKLEKVYGRIRPLWSVTWEDPNESGPNQEDFGPKKITEEWYHYDQDDERNLLREIPKKQVWNRWSQKYYRRLVSLRSEWWEEYLELYAKKANMENSLLFFYSV